MPPFVSYLCPFCPLSMPLSAPYQCHLLHTSPPHTHTYCCFCTLHVHHFVPYLCIFSVAFGSPHAALLKLRHVPAAWTKWNSPSSACAQQPRSPCSLLPNGTNPCSSQSNTLSHTSNSISFTNTVESTTKDLTYKNYNIYNLYISLYIIISNFCIVLFLVYTNSLHFTIMHSWTKVFAKTWSFKLKQGFKTNSLTRVISHQHIVSYLCDIIYK